MNPFEINLPGVAFCAVLWFGVTSLWYSPLLFEKGVSKIRRDSAAVETKYSQLWIFAAALLSGAFLDVLLNVYQSIGGTANWRTGAAIGLLLWLGAAIPTRTIELGFKRTSFDLFLIDAGNSALCYFFAGLLLGHWSNIPA